MNLGGDSPDEQDTVVLADAMNEGELERIPVGMFNNVFGGGIVRSSVNLVAGEPGAGKTTSFLQISDHVLDYYKAKEDVTLYVGSEQKAAEIGDFARRVGVIHTKRIVIIKAQGGLKRNLVDYFDSHAEGGVMVRHVPRLLIMDSVTGLIGRDLEMTVELARIMKQHSSERNFPTLIVNQINGAGDHVGLMKLQHEVDGLHIIRVDPPPVAFRYWECEVKNRFGQTPAILRMKMMDKDTKVVLGESGPGRLFEVPFEEEEDA